MSKWRLKIQYHVTGNTHENGYCSDPGEKSDVDYTKIIYKKVTKEWVNKYCESDGEVNYDGLSDLSYSSRECSGSGYCGTGVKWNAISADLVKINDVKSEFMNDYDSD